MKHKIALLFSIILLITNCSSNDVNDDTVDSDFEIELSYNENVKVDELVEVTIVGNEGFREVKASLDDSFNNSTGTLFFESETTHVRFFTFDKLGINTVYFKGYNEDGVESIKVLNINVVRGNSVKINAIEIVSFSNMDNTWDNEFAETDINRLADVFFLIRKSKAFFSDGEYNFNSDWHRSQVIENQGNLTWNLSEEDLYVSTGFPLNFIAADMDEEGQVGDLMLGRYYEYIGFSEIDGSQPETFTFNFPDIDLEFIITVEWPN